MVNTSGDGESKNQPDYTALLILTSLCAAEVAILYVLIVVETPAAPIVRRLLETRAGLVAVVASVVTFLLIAMAGVLLLGRRMSTLTKPQAED